MHRRADGYARRRCFTLRDEFSNAFCSGVYGDPFSVSPWLHWRGLGGPYWPGRL